jgi:hypothetical protein
VPDEQVDLAKINITYRRDRDAPEMMTLSDGASEVVLYPSPLGGMNMLLEIIDALLQLTPYGGELVYLWEGDQDYYRWRFQLDGDILHIQVNHLGNLYSPLSALNGSLPRRAQPQLRGWP